MLCCFRPNNILSSLVSMFNERWRKDFETLGIQSTVIDTALATRPKSYVRGTQRLSEDQRLSELTSLTRPILHRSIGSEGTFQLYKASMIVLGETIERNLQTSQHFASDLEEDIFRNPSKARCKGWPKTWQKRYASMTETLQSQAKKLRGVTCSTCKTASPSRIEVCTIHSYHQTHFVFSQSILPLNDFLVCFRLQGDALVVGDPHDGTGTCTCDGFFYTMRWFLLYHEVVSFIQKKNYVQTL